MTVVVEHLAEQAIPGKRLGRHVEHDPRSRDYAVDEIAGVTFLAVEHERFGGPFDQGNLGSCTGNAMAGWCNTAPKATAASTLLTETDAVRIYEEATKLDHVPGSYPPDDTGSSGLAVCKAAKAEGRISAYRHAFSIHAALLALQAAPVITGVPWYEGFDHPDSNGLVVRSGQVRGGHEFEVVSFTPVGAHYLDGLVGAWNSWGTAYGKSGRFYFTARTWAELLAEQGDCTVPIA